MPTPNDVRLSHDHSEVDRLIGEALSAVDDGADLFGIVDLIWARLAVHIRAEHLHLFPALRTTAVQFGDGETIELIANLRSDHDFFMKEFASVIKALRSRLSQDVKEPLTLIAHRLEIHNQLEENKIYPLIDKWLTDSERNDLIQRIAAELDNVPTRFRGPQSTRWA